MYVIAKLDTLEQKVCFVCTYKNKHKALSEILKRINSKYAEVSSQDGSPIVKVYKKKIGFIYSSKNLVEIYFILKTSTPIDVDDGYQSDSSDESDVNQTDDSDLLGDDSEKKKN